MRRTGGARPLVVVAVGMGNGAGAEDDVELADGGGGGFGVHAEMDALDGRIGFRLGLWKTGRKLGFGPPNI